MPFKAPDQSVCFVGRECFIKSGMGVRAEIILDENNPFGVAKVAIAQLAQDMGIVDTGPSVCDLDMPLAFQRRERHEQVGDTSAAVFIVMTDWSPRCHWDRRTRFRDQLFAGLIEADQRPTRVVWPRVDGQYVFHGGGERCVRTRWNYPVPAPMRLKFVFLSVRAIVLWCAVSTMPSSTTLSASRRIDQRA